MTIFFVTVNKIVAVAKSISFESQAYCTHAVLYQRWSWLPDRLTGRQSKCLKNDGRKDDKMVKCAYSFDEDEKRAFQGTGVFFDKQRAIYMKTKGELIIEVLKAGRDLSLSEIVDYLSETTGRPIKNTEVSPVLSKLSRPDKSEIGFFIQRRKKPKSPYRYKFVDEALEMTTQELIDLSHKTGKNRFTLENAVEKYPGIKKYVKSAMVNAQGKASDQLPETAEAVQEAAAAENTEESLDHEFNEVVRTLAAILSRGLTVNLSVNIRLNYE